MPRPRYESGEKTARERLDEAFWECLAEKPFDKITVADVSKRASVNRNTFYYHFEDMNALARTVMRETALEPEVVKFLLAQTLRGGSGELLAHIPNLENRVEHVCLLAGKNSNAALRQILRDTLLHAWSEAFGVDFEGLDLEGRLAVEFVLGGIMGIIAFRADSGIKFDLQTIYGYGLNRDAMQMLRHIPQIAAEAHGEQQVPRNPAH